MGMVGKEMGLERKEKEMGLMKRELGIYVHVPFCVRKCEYCDFLSVVGNDGVKREYVEGLLEEIENVELRGEYEVVSVFFGGGTPSVLDWEWIGKVLERLGERFVFGDGVEVSIECNPGTVDYRKFLGYREVGINRVSLGLQSVDDGELRVLGRVHTFAEFLECYEGAQEAGFGNINVDLMSGLPGQSLESWEKSLKTVAKLSAPHISAYSLIVEEGTPFGEMELDLPDEDVERGMYELTHDFLMEEGYGQYEISNYAKEGFECRHNVGYWRRREYLGIGIGAASLIDGVRYTNTRDMKVYLKESGQPERIRCDVEVLSSKAQMEEFMFLGLRLLEGVWSKEFYACFGVTIDAVYGEQIEKLVRQRLVSFADGNLKLTRKGISLSNYVFGELLLDA